MNHTPDSQYNSVITYGAVSLDNIVRLPYMPTSHRRARATADYYKLGGQALNNALPLSHWGHRVGVVGNRLGEDAYGDFIFNELERFPYIDTQWLQRDPRVRTPFARIFVTADGDTHFLGYWFEEASRISLSWEMLNNTRLFSTDVYGTEEHIAAARMAKAVGLTVVGSDVIDPEHGLLPLCDWVVSSRSYLETYFPEANPEDHLRKLQSRSPGTYILTDGPRSVCVLTPDAQWLEIAPYPLSPLDQLGAGDVFKAGIIHGILEKMPLLDTVRFANAAAALWVAMPSALKHPPSLEEIAALQEERVSRPTVPLWPREQETVCPVCRRVTPSALFEKHWEMDRRVVRSLRDQNPAWRRVDGACPTCVHETTQHVGLTRATASISTAHTDHPIYGQIEPQALPTGVRLRANPHYKGRGVTIAFLDSGFYPHPDLTQPRNRILSFVDASTEDIVVGADFSVPSVTSWHGMMTSVAAAGNGYLSQGYYAGIANEANLLLIKVSSPQMRIDEVDILRGLRWLASNWRDYGVKVVNISLAGDTGLRPDSELNELVNHLVDEGLVVVVAAGNAGQNDLCPPASSARAITVGGLDDRNSLDPATDRMWHSNWGRIADNMLKPELIAPSIWLAAPVLPGTSTAEQNLILDRLRRAPNEALPTMLAARLHDLGFDPALLDEPVESLRRTVEQKLMANKYISPFYQHVDGTSFAAPIVSSVVTQMLEANAALSPQRIKELLIATARPLPGVPEYQQGYGVVMPGQAVAAALHERYGPYEPGNLSPQISNESVRFILHEPRAHRVSLIAEWNDWNPAAQPMDEREPGVWTVEMKRLPPGRYHYKFLVNDLQWQDDPENLMKAVDGYGGFNGLLILE